jgi:hypothetical protein
MTLPSGTVSTHAEKGGGPALTAVGPGRLPPSTQEAGPLAVLEAMAAGAAAGGTPEAVTRDHTRDQQIRRTRQVSEQILSGRRPGRGSVLPPTTWPGDAPWRRHERRWSPGLEPDYQSLVRTAVTAAPLPARWVTGHPAPPGRRATTMRPRTKGKAVRMLCSLLITGVAGGTGRLAARSRNYERPRCTITT